MRTDTLIRDDMNGSLAPKKKVLRVRWTVLDGATGDAVTSRLYTAKQAARFVRLAKKFGRSTYAVRFGKVAV